MKSFLGAIQYLSKYIENLSAQTDLLRQLLKKKNNWNWSTEHSEAFNQLKQKITEIPCLAHYSSVRPNTLATDASTKGLSATLWQEQKNGDLKPIAFASRFQSETEKICNQRARIISGSLGLRTIPTIHLRQARQIIDGSPSTRTSN